MGGKLVFEKSASIIGTTDVRAAVFHIVGVVVVHEDLTCPPLKPTLHAYMDHTEVHTRYNVKHHPPPKSKI